MWMQPGLKDDPGLLVPQPIGFPGLDVGPRYSVDALRLAPLHSEQRFGCPAVAPDEIDRRTEEIDHRVGLNLAVGLRAEASSHQRHLQDVLRRAMGRRRPYDGDAHLRG